KLFKLMIGELEIPTGFNGTPALLKLNSVGFGQVSFGIALHMNDAKLDVRVGEKTGGDRLLSAEIIIHDDHHTAEAAFDDAAQDQLPIFEIFATWSGDTGENLFFTVTSQTDDDVNACRS